MHTNSKISGLAVRTFLRKLVMAEPDAAADLADRIADHGAAHIRDMRVVVRTEHLWLHRRSGRSRHSLRSTLSGAAVAKPTASSTSPAIEPAPVCPVLAAAPFDPYEFAVEAMLIKQGEAALAARLALIAEAASLQALAKAQRIGLDPDLAGNPDADLELLRQDIIRGASKRIAGRRAAAG